ncbi:MAG: transposase [Proteobacteria bacterium]|nr:transposase [Pseudomonadota bacterium]
MEINKERTAFSGFQNSGSTATIDMDATLVSTNKIDALFSYKGFKAYQPLNTWWFEQGIILHTEFRDGNVPAGFQQLRVFKDALGCLPEQVQTVRVSSDTACYQHDLLRYCSTGENSQFGVIEFAIGCNVTKEFKKAFEQIEESEWKPIYNAAWCGGS